MIKIDGYSDGMENRVWTSVGNKREMRPQQGGFDRQWDVESASVVQCEYGNAVGFLQDRGRTRLYSLGGESLFDGTLEFVVLRPLR